MLQEKEEILKRTIDGYRFADYPTLDTEQAILGAMDEYAKQQAVAFLKWKEGLNLIKEQRSEKWLINLAMSEYSFFSDNDEDLYQKFIEHQNKKP